MPKRHEAARSGRLWAALCAAAILGFGAPSGDMSRAQTMPEERAGVFEIRGMSYPSFRNGRYAGADSTASLAALAGSGANFVAIIPTRFSKTIKDGTFAATSATEADANVVKAIGDAHAAGLAVLLKPHVDASDGKPRSLYAPADVGAWFASYEAFLVHYAALAARNHVEMFSVGCELDSLAGPRYRDRWLHAIGAVRKVFAGPLLYAASGNEADKVSFWDALDYIGVDAYDPLSRAPNPSVAEIAAGWRSVSQDGWAAARGGGRSPLESYRALSERHHKPVIFAEIGYKSVAGAMTRPGDWKFGASTDLALQARAYEAFFETWSRETAWMKGAFLWNWEPVPHPERSPGGLSGYTPQNKPAGAVISRWYQAMAAAGRDPSAPATSAGR